MRVVSENLYLNALAHKKHVFLELSREVGALLFSHEHEASRELALLLNHYGQGWLNHRLW